MIKWFEKGDTIPGGVHWKYKYFKNSAYREKWFDKKGKTTKKIIYYKVGTHKYNIGRRIKRLKHEYPYIIADSLYSYNISRTIGKKTIHKTYYVNEDGTKGKLKMKIVYRNSKMIKSKEYDLDGDLIRKNKFE